MQPIVSTTTAFLLLAGLSCVAGTATIPPVGNSMVYTIGTDVFKINNAGIWIDGDVTDFDDETNMYTVMWSPDTSSSWLEFQLNATITKTYVENESWRLVLY
mmetsp:Transcript_11621/g.23601  ORF Transcript_11621/g.23601 Transcript_11621/m.23601 type:complete len:102 (-) Transcript_11621:219-524(-)